MRFWVTLEGREAEVEFRTEGGTLGIELEGRRLAADFVRLPDGETYSLLVDGRSYEVSVVPAGERLEVTVRGVTLPVEVRHPLEKMLQSSARATLRAGAETIAAPMPGLLVAFHVRAGDVVAAGQAVAVVEAMKMQNELAARAAGVVIEMLVEPGTSVSAGQPLLRLRSTPA